MTLNTEPMPKSGARLGCLLALLLLMCPAYVPADSATQNSRTYGGILLASSKQDTQPAGGQRYNVPRSNLRGRLGYQITNTLAVEAHIGAMAQSNITKDPVFTAGLYARVQLGSSKLKSYLLLGAGNVQTYDNTAGGSEISESGFSFGLGLALYGSRDGALVLEALRLVDTAETTVDSVGIGYSFHF